MNSPIDAIPNIICLKQEHAELLEALQRAIHAIDEAILAKNTSLLTESAYVFEARVTLAEIERS